MLNAVRLDGDLYLVNIGFVGPSFLDPLRVSLELQWQYGVRVPDRPGRLSAGTLIHGRSFENGKRILIGRRYLVSAAGAAHVRAIIGKAEQRRSCGTSCTRRINHRSISSTRCSSSIHYKEYSSCPHKSAF
jgi:amide synthase